MTTTQRTYRRLLATLSATAIVSVSLLVVMTDQGEDREPWEFTPAGPAVTR